MEYFGIEQEYKYHTPICEKICKKLKPNNYTKITSSNKISIFIRTTYCFYGLNNYVIFKIHITSLYEHDDIILIDVEFTYSSNTLYYWTQINNPTLKLHLKKTDQNKINSHIISINEFIQLNLSKNNLKN